MRGERIGFTWYEGLKHIWRKLKIISTRYLVIKNNKNWPLTNKKSRIESIVQRWHWLLNGGLFAEMTTLEISHRINFVCSKWEQYNEKRRRKFESSLIFWSKNDSFDWAFMQNIQFEKIRSDSEPHCEPRF